MNIQKRTDGGIVVMDVAGEFFGGPETQALERAIAEEIAVGNVRILLDLSRCRTMNSTAFGVLIEGHHACDRMGGVIKLCGAGHRMKSLLGVLHGEQLFEHHATEAEALASFRERATA
jgi:anti-anti-sigma factor